MLTLLQNLIIEKNRKYSLETPSTETKVANKSSFYNQKLNAVPSCHQISVPRVRSEANNVTFNRSLETTDPHHTSSHFCLEKSKSREEIDNEISIIVSLIKLLGIQGSDRPLYLARKLSFESRLGFPILRNNVQALQSEISQMRSDPKFKRRGTRKRSRRGGKKNRKTKS